MRFHQTFKFFAGYQVVLSCRALMQQNSRRAQFGVVQISTMAINFQAMC